MSTTSTRARVIATLICVVVPTTGIAAIGGCSSGATEVSGEVPSAVVTETDGIDLGCPSCEDGSCDNAAGDSEGGLATADTEPLGPGAPETARIKFLNEPSGRPKTIADCCEQLKGKMTVCGKVLVICAAFAVGCVNEGTVAHQVCKAIVEGAKPVLVKQKVEELLCKACKEDNAQECVIEAGPDAKPDVDPKDPKPKPKK